MKKNVKNMFSVFFIVIITLVIGNALLLADNPGTDGKTPDKKEKKADDKKKSKEKEPVLHYEVTVTATRSKRETFETPQPVSVVTRKKIEEKKMDQILQISTSASPRDILRRLRELDDGED